MRVLVFFAVFLSVSGLINAQIDKCQHAIDTLVVTAQYAPGSVENAIQKIAVINREKIDAMGAQNLANILSNEMNIRLSQDNILGSGLRLQGISGQNVKILVDGIPITGRLNGNIDISQINLNNVERIEIVEGPLSVNFGTDALAGTINIITKKSQTKKFEISNDNYYESIGNYNIHVRSGLQRNKTLFTLNGGRNFFDGWSPGEIPFYWNTHPMADSSRFSAWKPKEQVFGGIVAAQYWSELKLTYSGDYFNETLINKGRPRPPYGESAFDDYYRTFRYSNSLTLTGQLSPSYYLNAMIAYTGFKRIKNTYFKDLTDLSETLTNNPEDQDTTRIKSYISRASISSTKLNSLLNFEFGYDVLLETAHGIRIKDSKQAAGDYALFGSIEYQPSSRIIIKPGLRLIYNTVYKAPPVPAINFKYSPNNRLSFRFSYARGFRAPSLKELYFYFADINHFIVGNPLLNAEYSNNFQLNMTSIRKNKFATLKNDIGAFYNQIDNMISLARINENQYSYFNIGYYQTMGIETKFELTISDFSVSLGALYTGRYNPLHQESASERIYFSPEGKFNVRYFWVQPGLNLNIYYKYTGLLPQYFVTENNQIERALIQDYHLADCSVSKKISQERILVTIGCKNIFNVTNISGISPGDAHSASLNSLAIGMGRSFFFRVEIKLSSND